MERVESKESISVLWRGNKFVVEMNSDATLKELGDELHKLTEVKADTMRFIVPQSSNGSSKLLSPFSDELSSRSLHELGIVEGKFIRMMGVSESEVEEVLQDAKKDFRIAGFDEEEKRRRQLLSRGPHSSLRLPEGPYIFCDFRTLQIPGMELNPPPSEALKRMHMLAADTGIVAIMNKHRWRVGIMTELAPVGYVGVSPKCILGYNKNHGEEISLRLRTDDLKGFRKYESIKKTLLHELAHMVYSEHDANFYALDKQLNREAASLDWTRSRSHTLGGFGHSDHLDELVDDSGNIDVSHKLGGNLLEPQFSARESSVAAAYNRLTNTSGNSSVVSEVSEEPDPDDTGYGEPDIINTPQTNANSESAKEVQHGHGPVNAGFVNGNYFEPDPDDSQGGAGGQTFQSEQFTKIDGNNLFCIPASAVFDMSLFVPSPTNNQDLAANRTCVEPDSDDLEVALSEDVAGRSDSHNSQEVEVLDSRMPSNRHIDEPDPDDSQPEKKMLENGYIVELKECESLLNISVQCRGNLGQKYKDMDAGYYEANQNMQSEPDPDDNLTRQQEIKETDINEPDPDDNLTQQQQIKEMDMSEPDPDDNLTQQQQIKEMDMSEPDPDDQELQRIQDPVTEFCRRLQRAIQMLRAEVNPMEVTTVLQTLFKIIGNVIENPNNIKFKRLRKANPAFQRTVAKYKAAMEILFLIGFNEDVAWDEIGKAETYLILKRNDPGLLWLAKSSLEACVAC